MLLKWLVLVAIVVAVWFGFRAISRRNRALQAKARQQEHDRVEDMTACSVCGTFVPAGQRHCGRADCPY